MLAPSFSEKHCSIQVYSRIMLTGAILALHDGSAPCLRTPPQVLSPVRAFGFLPCTVGRQGWRRDVPTPLHSPRYRLGALPRRRRLLPLLGELAVCLFALSGGHYQIMMVSKIARNSRRSKQTSCSRAYVRLPGLRTLLLHPCVF